MKTLIISGSHRKHSQSARVAEYIQKRIAALKVGTDSNILDLGNYPLPMWDEDAPGATSEKWQNEWTPWLNIAKTSDALVVICPEWAGMVPPALVNVLLLASGTGAFAHKPALIVTVSAGKGGAYPVSELRIAGYKNTYLCYLPEHIIIRNVNEMLQGETAQNDDDAYVRNRLDYALKLLGGYARGLSEMRAAGLVDIKTYPNGM